jgi:hypothetical protein
MKMSVLWLYRVSQKERSIFLRVIVLAILSKKKVCIYMCPIPKVSEITATSLFISKVVDNKEILRTVPNTGIFCLNDKVGTVYLI